MAHFFNLLIYKIFLKLTTCISIMSKKYVNVENLLFLINFYNFINNEAIPGTEISKQDFWKGLSKVSHELNPKNIELLRLKKKITNRYR